MFGWLRKPDTRACADGDLVERGLSEAFVFFEKDHDVEALEDETEFWISVENCELCDGKQLCSAHYERMFATL